MHQEPGNPTPFKLGWYSFDLGRGRPCDGTYPIGARGPLPSGMIGQRG
jgi:hypothetical protein